MRVCIPTETKDGLQARVHGHFGSASYFTVYDTQTKSLEVIDNTNAHHVHGMCHPIGVIGSLSVDVVVCQGMGMRAVQKLNESHIKAYRAQGETVGEIITRYEKGGLEEITVHNACSQHGCH